MDYFNIHPLHISHSSGHKNIESLNSHPNFNKNLCLKSSLLQFLPLRVSPNLNIQSVPNENTIPSNKLISLDISTGSFSSIISGRNISNQPV